MGSKMAQRIIIIIKVKFYVLFNKQSGVFYQVQRHKAIVECFIPDKTRTASLLNGFKNEPFRKFIDVKMLKIDLV